MRILLIMPDAHMHKLRLGPFVRSFREAPLTLTTLAALVPSGLDADVEVVDGSVSKVPTDFPADLVGISAITGCARPAYELANHYRKRGIPVVLGGVHVSVLPGEALAHADSIVVGRGERAWPQLLADFRRGQMKRVYREHPLADGVLADVPSPQRSLQQRGRYMVPNTVQATRGCRRVCDFCTVPAVWPQYLKRPIADVIRDIKLVSGKTIVFNDVSLIDDPEYAKELFTAMIPLRKRWGGLVTADGLQNGELLDVMVASGCVYLLIGFESGNQATLRDIRKNFNHALEYKDFVRRLQKRGITVQGCFVFGFDHDDLSVFESTVQLVQDIGIDIPRYSLYTPYPGTALFRRLMEERRIISFNWKDYDTMHVVIQPKQMTPEELYQGFKWAYRETFRLPRIMGRMNWSDVRCAINFFGNLCYRVFIDRLDNEARFALPYSIDDPGNAPADSDWHIPAHLEEAPCFV